MPLVKLCLSSSLSLALSLSLSLLALHSNPLDNSRPRSSSPRRLRRLPLPTRPRERRRYGLRSSSIWSKKLAATAAAAAAIESCDRLNRVCPFAFPPRAALSHGATTSSRFMSRHGIALSSECSEETRWLEIRAAGGDERFRSMGGGGCCKASLFTFFRSPFFSTLSLFLSLSQTHHPHHLKQNNRNGPRER